MTKVTDSVFGKVTDIKGWVIARGAEFSPKGSARQNVTSSYNNLAKE